MWHRIMLIIESFASKKFIITVLTEILSFIGLIQGKITDGTWQVLAIAILGIYAGANVWEKIQTGSNTKSTV